MTNLITNNDFTNEPFIVYLDSDNYTDYFNGIVTRYQKDILINILGEIEYYNFENDFDSEAEPAPQTQKWIDFLDGVDYTVNSIHYDYQGLKPLLKRFIYYYWQRETISNLSEKGEQQNLYKNNLRIIPRNKMVKAYNEACDLVRDCKRTYAPTVYKFLDESNNTFADWNYTGFTKINTTDFI